MNITDFKIKAHKICDHWYFKQTDSELQVWERPYKVGPGFMGDYQVMAIPLSILCHASMRDQDLTSRLQQLQRMHWVREHNQQVKDVDAMLARNKARSDAVASNFSRETKAFFKQERKVFAGLRDETGIGTRAYMLDKIMKEKPWLSYDDAKKVLNSMGR